VQKSRSHHALSVTWIKELFSKRNVKNITRNLAFNTTCHTQS